jgi:uncharacterized protein GlcG (DUF336 family)
VLVQRSLGLDDAQRVINTVIDDARKKNWRIALAVVDRTGELIACARMDGRAARFLKAAHRKAYSAAIFEMDTDGIVKFWNRQGEQGHRGPADWNDPMLTTLPGGLCIVHDGKGSRRHRGRRWGRRRRHRRLGFRRNRVQGPRPRLHAYQHHAPGPAGLHRSS